MQNITNSQHVWQFVNHYAHPIEEFLQDVTITEICIDTYKDILIERHGQLEKVENEFESEAHLERFIVQIANALGQAVSVDKAPMLDARLADGSRIHAVLFPLSTRGHSMTIRRFSNKTVTPEQLIEWGMITEKQLTRLQRAVIEKRSIVVSGSTGSGKTTMIKALSNFIPKKERVIVIEDTQEIVLKHPSWLSREVAKRDPANNATFSMSDMIASALRERPDRIIVGELRSPDAAQAYLTALNTGHRGCITTLHANNAEDALYRLDGLVCASQAKLPMSFIQQQVRRNIDVVIHLHKHPQLGRKVKEIMECAGPSTVIPAEAGIQHSN